MGNLEEYPNYAVRIGTVDRDRAERRRNDSPFGASQGGHMANFLSARSDHYAVAAE